MHHVMFIRKRILIMIERRIYVIDLLIIITKTTLVPLSIRVFRDLWRNTRETKKEKRDPRGVEGPKQKEKGLERVGIFNLGSVLLTDAEKLVLDKGLKFVPPKPLNKCTMFIDVQKFTRKLSIQRHFLAQPPRLTPAEEVSTFKNVTPSEDGYVHSGLSNLSLFNPPGTITPSIQVFRSLVLQDLEKLSHPKKKYQSGTKAIV